MEDPDHPQHPEDHHAVEEKEREDRQQFNDAICGFHIFPDRSEPRFILIEEVCRPDPKHIFHDKDGNRDPIDSIEQIPTVMFAMMTSAIKTSKARLT